MNPTTPQTIGSLCMLHETEHESWSPVKYQANITYSMFCIFPRSEPVAVFFLYWKMRKKAWHFEMPRRMQNSFLADHQMSCWLCILCAIKKPCHCFLITLLPLFPVELASCVFSESTLNNSDTLGLLAFPVLSVGLCVGIGPQRSSRGDWDSVHGADWPSKRADWIHGQAKVKFASTCSLLQDCPLSKSVYS